MLPMLPINRCSLALTIGSCGVQTGPNPADRPWPRRRAAAAAAGGGTAARGEAGGTAAAETAMQGSRSNRVGSTDFTCSFNYSNRRCLLCR